MDRIRIELYKWSLYLKYSLNKWWSNRKKVLMLEIYCLTSMKIQKILKTNPTSNFISMLSHKSQISQKKTCTFFRKEWLIKILLLFFLRFKLLMIKAMKLLIDLIYKNLASKCMTKSFSFPNISITVLLILRLRLTCLFKYLVWLVIWIIIVSAFFKVVAGLTIV